MRGRAVARSRGMDPTRGLAFGYVVNRMKLGLTGDDRSRKLVEASDILALGAGEWPAPCHRQA